MSADRARVALAWAFGQMIFPDGHGRALIDALDRLDALDDGMLHADRRAVVEECKLLLEQVATRPWDHGLYVGGGHGDPAMSWEQSIRAAARALDAIIPPPTSGELLGRAPIEGPGGSEG